MLVPAKTILGKKSPTAVELVSPEEREQRNLVERRNRALLQEPQSINNYGDELKPEEIQVSENMEEDGYEPSFTPSDEDAPLPEPLEKKPRLDDDDDEALGMDTTDTNMLTLDCHHPPQHDNLEWLNQLVLEEEQSWKSLNAALDTNMNFFSIEFDLNLVSNRSKKDFVRNPNNFLVKKLKDSEVNFGKLSNEHRALFNRAKGKEVSSFVKNEAVRRCLDDQEIKEALGSGRILRARWVLTWKLVPPEDQHAALEDSKKNPETLHTRDGLRKAKARIVLLGFEHPELGSSGFKTSSPVQSMLARNALYQMVCQHDWTLEGLDLATAFLQTNPTDADAQLWTSGVAELREALQVGPEGIMKILRNIYGSTTAPRGLWLDLHKRLSSIGGKPAMRERCLWLWTSAEEKDQAGHPKVIGMMGGHVDDFHRIGDPNSEEWQKICKLIDGLYSWGAAKRDEYRHAGTDLKLSSRCRWQSGDHCEPAVLCGHACGCEHTT